jgi:cell division protein FtsL
VRDFLSQTSIDKQTLQKEKLEVERKRLDVEERKQELEQEIFKLEKEERIAMIALFKQLIQNNNLKYVIL